VASLDMSGPWPVVGVEGTVAWVRGMSTMVACMQNYNGLILAMIPLNKYT